jgi:hypothetical protein
LNIEQTPIVVDRVFEWKQRVDEFVASYMGKFAKETFEVGFSNDDPKSDGVMYDLNKLEVIWLSETTVELFGLISEIQTFKENVKAQQQQ